MPLETASYLSQLNSSYPAPTDELSQGDDHLRLIKAVLLATFPNITGPVTATEADLNSIAASIASSGVPIGAITAWYGSSALVPTGWHLCDGTTAIARTDGSGTIDAPDLRNLVIMGAGSVAAQGTAFGSANQTATSAAAGGHSHATTAGGGTHAHTGVSVAGHALSISEMPAHTHTYPGNPGDGGGSEMQTTGGPTTTITSSSTGGGAAHSHDLTWPGVADGAHTHTTDAAADHQHGVTVPVYQPALALHYIIKV